MNFESLRHPISALNEKILNIDGYVDRYNPNQTTVLATVVTVTGVALYVYGILTQNHSIALTGMGAFGVGRYGDLLDGDHARMLKLTGRWKTKIGGIFDADMDKVATYSALGALLYTHTLPETHTYILLSEIAIMGSLDGISYGMRSNDRDWKKILQSIHFPNWDEPVLSEQQEEVSSKKIKNDANIFGKLKTLSQNLAILVLGMGPLIESSEISQPLQKAGHLLLLTAISLAGISLWKKRKKL